MNDDDDNSVDLLEVLYGELKALASRNLSRERADHTLQPTALVHEAYLRMGVADSQAQWHDREHFMSAAAEAMRRVLVDHARRKLSMKRGGKFIRVSSFDASIESNLGDWEILAIHEALDIFSKEDPLAAELVKLRIFAGFSNVDAAKQLKLERSKADRIWAFAKARLYTLIEGTKEFSSDG